MKDSVRPNYRTEFKLIGYSVDYHVEGKYIGSKTIEAPDREEIGYYGKKIEVATEDIKFKNNKRIKKGTEFYTFLYPMNARIKK